MLTYGASFRAIIPLLLLLLPTGSPGPEPPDGALEALQGTWEGRDTGNLRSLWTLQVTGREFRFDGPGTQEWYEGTVVLPGGSAGHIDLRILRCECAYRDSTSLGLYDLQGDRLTFQGAEPGYDRPESLQHGGRTLLMHLRRLPPPD